MLLWASYSLIPAFTQSRYQPAALPCSICASHNFPLFLAGAHLYALHAGLGISPAFKNGVSGQCYRSGIGDRSLINDSAFLRRQVARYKIHQPIRGAAKLEVRKNAIPTKAFFIESLRCWF
jgi:hypothetical protein